MPNIHTIKHGFLQIFSPSILLTLHGIFLFVSVGLFFASLPFDCFYRGNQLQKSPVGPGIWLLMMGWLGIFEKQFAWYTNPFLFVTWITMCIRTSRKVPFCCAIAAFALAFSFVFYGDTLANESGGRANIVGYGPGYWFWLSSTFIALIGCVFGLIAKKRLPRSIQSSFWF